MKNVLYMKTIKFAQQAADGETPTSVYVTEEVNFYAVWLEGHDYHRALLHIEPVNRNAAIEKGVEFGAYREHELAKIVMRRP